MPSEGNIPKEGARWPVGELPFMFRHCTVPSNAEYGVPDRLPFSLETDQETGRIRQVYRRETAEIMGRAYQHGSVLSGAMDDHGIGQSYALDFLSYIRAVVPDIAGKRILEIGCGTGYLMSLLRDLGGKVLGVEPGPQGESAHARFGVQVMKEFFPSSQLPGHFDVVIAYGVLEHLPDPGVLLRDIRKQLAPDGTVILAVPSCEPYIRSGDISCLFHEHWSYFTEQTLRATVQREGFAGEVAPAGFGGSLYCAARVSGGRGLYTSPGEGAQGLDAYRVSAERVLRRLGDLLRGARQSGQDVGIYAAGRLLNALALLRDVEEVGAVRFFDDNEDLHGLYFPGFPFPIESWARFLKAPPAITLVASRTFEPVIRRRVAAFSTSRIVGWEDVFGPGHA